VTSGSELMSAEQSTAEPHRFEHLSPLLSSLGASWGIGGLRIMDGWLSPECWSFQTHVVFLAPFHRLLNLAHDCSRLR
jgi:hypothetical protein